MKDGHEETDAPSAKQVAVFIAAMMTQMLLVLMGALLVTTGDVLAIYQVFMVGTNRTKTSC